MRYFEIDIRTPDGRFRAWSEAKRELKVEMAKAYLKERGLTPMPIGRCWSRPYTPPTIDRFSSKLQEVLLNGRVHRS